MSQLVVITAVSLNGDVNNEQHITKVKAFALSSSIITVEDLITTMRARGSNLVVRSGSTTGPIVKIIEGTPPFIRSNGNGLEQDNLLSLRRF